MTKLIAPTVEYNRPTTLKYSVEHASGAALKITPEPIEQGLILRLAGT